MLPTTCSIYFTPNVEFKVISRVVSIQAISCVLQFVFVGELRDQVLERRLSS